MLKEVELELPNWPEGEETGPAAPAEAFDATVDLITVVRKFKSEKTLSMGAPLKSVIVAGEGERRSWLESASAELHSALRAERLGFDGGPGDLDDDQVVAGVELIYAF